jgi:beta-galactosidase
MAGTFPARILYGADYNPEQWPETVWVEDMRFMKQARVNMVSINIFSWAMLEPQPGEYRFETLDRVVDMLAEHGIAADLATATASPPTWMSRLYPLMLPVTWDGRRMYHGSPALLPKQPGLPAQGHAAGSPFGRTLPGTPGSRYVACQ